MESFPRPFDAERRTKMIVQRHGGSPGKWAEFSLPLPQLLTELERRPTAVARAGFVALDRADVAPVVDFVNLTLDDALDADDLQELRVRNLARQ